MTQDQCVFIRGFRVKRALFGIRLIQIGSGSDAQRSPYRYPTVQSDNGLRKLSDTIRPPINSQRTLQSDEGLHNTSSFLGDDSHIVGSLDAMRPPIHHENTQRSPYRDPTSSNDGLPRASSDDSRGSSSGLDTIGPTVDHENTQRSPYQHPTVQVNGLRNKSPSLGDLNIGGSSSSLDTIGPPINDENFNDENLNDNDENLDDENPNYENLNDENLDSEHFNDEDLDYENLDDGNLNNYENLSDENLQRSPHRHPTLQRNDGLHDASSFLGDDSHVGGPGSNSNTIGPPINHDNPPYRHPTLQRNDYLRSASSFLSDDSHVRGSSSSLDTIDPRINHENPQFPYPSSTALQSNGSISNASSMTSLSYNSLIGVPNDIAAVRPPGSQDTSPLSVRKDLHGSHTRMSGTMGLPPGAQPPVLLLPPQELHYEDEEFDYILAYYSGGDETAGSESRSRWDTSRGRLR
jgi:hypothetical protein